MGASSVLLAGSLGGSLHSDHKEGAETEVEHGHRCSAIADRG